MIFVEAPATKANGAALLFTGNDFAKTDVNRGR